MACLLAVVGTPLAYGADLVWTNVTGGQWSVAANWSPNQTPGAVDRVLTLRDSAVATAGNTENFVTLDGTRVGHLFDAARGRPSNPHLSASVVARTGTDSDTGSNLAFLLGKGALACLPGVLDTHFVG